MDGRKRKADGELRKEDVDRGAADADDDFPSGPMPQASEEEMRARKIIVPRSMLKSLAGEGQANPFGALKIPAAASAGVAAAASAASAAAAPKLSFSDLSKVAGAKLLGTPPPISSLEAPVRSKADADDDDEPTAASKAAGAPAPAPAPASASASAVVGTKTPTRAPGAPAPAALATAAGLGSTEPALSPDTLRKPQFMFAPRDGARFSFGSRDDMAAKLAAECPDDVPAKDGEPASQDAVSAGTPTANAVPKFSFAFNTGSQFSFRAPAVGSGERGVAAGKAMAAAVDGSGAPGSIFGSLLSGARATAPRALPTAAKPKAVTMAEVAPQSGEDGERTSHESRAKVFTMASGEREWRERGVGGLKLNTAPDGRSRVLVRTDGTHRLLVNSPLFAGLKVAVVNERNVRLMTVDAVPALGELAPPVSPPLVTFLFRFAGKTEANAFAGAVAAAIAEQPATKPAVASADDASAETGAVDAGTVE